MVDDQKVVQFYQNHSRQETECYFKANYNLSRAQVRKVIVGNKCRLAKNYNTLTTYQKEIVSGSMLGDGSLRRITTKIGTSRFVEFHSNKQKDYLDWKCQQLCPLSKSCFPNKTNSAWCFETISTPEFGVLEREWYVRNNNGEYVLNSFGKRMKRIPDKFTLTPLMVAIWYFDDGYVDVDRNRCVLCTNSFTYKECERLVGQLRELGVANARVKWHKQAQGKKEPIIKISSSSFCKFIDIVRPCLPCSCLAYKLPM